MLGVRIPPGLPRKSPELQQTNQENDGISIVASITETWTNLKTFLAETRAEMKKVTFPPRQEVITTTTVVVVASVVFALFLWFSDIVILEIYEGVLRLFGRA